MRRRFCSLVTFVALTGCASLGPSTEEVEQTVRNEREVVDESQGELRSVKASWSDGALVATFERSKRCQPYREFEVETQTYTRRPAQNLVPSLLLSGGFLVAGIAAGVAFASASQTAEYQATGEEEFHPADGLALGALVGVLGAGYGLYNAAQVIRGSRAVRNGEPIVEERREPLGEAEACGVAGVPTVVTLNFTSGEFRRTFEDGRVRLDFPRDAALCPESTIGNPVRIDWGAGAETGTLWVGSLEDCARAHAASRHLEAAVRFASTQGDRTSVAKASSELVQATRMLDGLSDRNQRRADLLAKAEEVRDMVQAAAAAGLEGMLQSLEASAEDSDFDELYESGRLAVDTSQLVEGSTPATVMRVHRVLGTAARRAEDAELISTGNATLAQCLVDAVCEAGVDREELLALYAPLVRRAQARLEKSADRVRRAARKDAVPSVAGTIQAEASVMEWCNAVAWKDDLATTCQSLIQTRKEAWATLAEREQDLVRQNLKRTERAWKSIFPKCRKVSRGIAAFKELPRSQCGADCRKALTRLQADFDELSVFSVEKPLWNATSLKAVRDGCERAGCPKCP